MFGSGMSRAASHNTTAHRQRRHEMRGSRRRAAASIDKSERRRTAPDQGQRTAPCADMRCRRDAGRARYLAEDDCQHDRDRHPFKRRQAAGRAYRWRAKNAGDSDLTRTCAGRPSASHSNVCAVAKLSDAVNTPCSNNSRTMGSPSTTNPSVAGKARPTASSSAARLRAHEAADPRRCSGARQFGHQHRAHGGADDAERQFDQAIGEIQPATRPTGEDEAITAPAMTSNCGPALAVMPGIALAEKAAHLCIKGRCEAGGHCRRRRKQQN